MSSSLPQTVRTGADVKAGVSFGLITDTHHCPTKCRKVDFSRSTPILLVNRRSETLAIRRLWLETYRRSQATSGRTKGCDEMTFDDDTAVQQLGLSPGTTNARQPAQQHDQQLPSLDHTTRHVISLSNVARQSEVSKLVKRKVNRNRTSGRNRKTASAPIRPLLPDIDRKRDQRKQHKNNGARQMNTYRLLPLPSRPCHTFTTHGTATVTPELNTTSRSARSMFATSDQVQPTPHVTLAVVPCKNIVIDGRWDRGDYRKTRRGALYMGWC